MMMEKRQQEESERKRLCTFTPKIDKVSQGVFVLVSG
jgi:hypothetical protein